MYRAFTIPKHQPRPLQSGETTTARLVAAFLTALLSVGWPLGYASLETTAYAQVAQGEATAGEVAQVVDGEQHEDAAEPHEEATHAEEGEHGGGIWEVLARLVNFVILVGVLVYLLRAQAATYLRQRAEQITSDLVTAASTQEDAARQIEAIDRKRATLPQELETLKARGTEEIASEGASIRHAAERERERLLQQARREIDIRMRVARRELTEYAVHLVTQRAADGLRQSMTGEDHLRLANQYVSRMGGAE